MSGGIIAAFAIAVESVMCAAFGASIDAYLNITGMLFAAMIITAPRGGKRNAKR